MMIARRRKRHFGTRALHKGLQRPGEDPSRTYILDVTPDKAKSKAGVE